MSFRTIQWRDHKVVMIDQTRLPAEEVYNEYADYRGVAEAIRGMIIRGAPAIGVAAAMGIALGARDIAANDHDSFFREFDTICAVMAATRPTAVNLFWAIDRMKRVATANRHLPLSELRQLLIAEAVRVEEEDQAICRAIGGHGADLIPDGATVLTHCNAGDSPPPATARRWGSSGPPTRRGRRSASLPTRPAPGSRGRGSRPGS